jgi:hypothetical protein
VVFEFLKKKFQDLTASAVSTATEPEASVRVDDGYEARRARAEELHEKGETPKALALLEELAAELAGAGSFPLAVAVRHQISAWTSGPPAAQTAAQDGEAMARQRSESGTWKVQHGGPADAGRIPEGLERSRFFADMSSEEIAGFIASTERRTFEEGQDVVEQGKGGRSLFIVTRGILRVEATGPSGGTLRMGVLTMGDVFGEVAFLTGRPRTATVIAETGAECLEIGEEAWTGILGRYPRVRQVLEEVHRERARFAADAILEDVRRRRKGGET